MYPRMVRSMVTTSFRAQREQMVKRYIKKGYLNSREMINAMNKVRRELFMAEEYVSSAYKDQPFHIPGSQGQLMPQPSVYPMFYEPLEIRKGDKMLEVGTGSGYGAALARELVGRLGKVVTVEIDEETYMFAKGNLEKTGYHDVTIIYGDGSKGCPDLAPFDKICITASCNIIPPSLIDQLKSPGRLVAPLGSTDSFFGQDLVHLRKDLKGRIKIDKLAKVNFAPLLVE